MRSRYGSAQSLASSGRRDSGNSLVSATETTASTASDTPWGDFNSFQAPPGDAAEHVVLDDDTLAGLCLRYGISARDLRRANGLLGENIHQHATLKLPAPRNRPRRAAQARTPAVLARLLRNATGVDAAEAKRRLESAHGDLDAALAAYEAERDPFSGAPPPPPLSPPDSVRRGAATPGGSRLRPRSQVLVHLDAATGLRDVGVLAAMDVYVVAELLVAGPFGSVLVAATARSAAASLVGDHWRWSAAAAGSSCELAAPAKPADLRLRLRLVAPHAIMEDAIVGETADLPLAGLADRALATASVAPQGFVTFSLHAHCDLPRAVVRAIPVVDAPDARRVPLVEARAVFDLGEPPLPPPRLEATACCLATPLG